MTDGGTFSRFVKVTMLQVVLMIVVEYVCVLRKRRGQFRSPLYDVQGAEHKPESKTPRCYTLVLRVLVIITRNGSESTIDQIILSLFYICKVINVQLVRS